MANAEQLKRSHTILKRAYDMHRVGDLYKRRWSGYEKIWKMVQKGRTGEDEWRADLPDTWPFATIKTAQSAFVDSKVSPIIIRHPDDPKSKAEDLQNLYQDIAEKGNLDQELYLMRLDAFKLGNAYGKVVYVKDTRLVWDIEKFDPIKDEFKWVKKEITEFDDPKTIRVSPYLMLIDDLARFSWDTVRDCIEVEVMARDEAKARYGHLIPNFDDVPQTTYLLKQLKAESATQVAETDGKGLRGTDFEVFTRFQFFAPGFDWSNDVVEILHYWNRGIETPSGALDSYEILMNGYPVKTDTENKPSPVPYIHKQLPYFHIPYSPYGGDEHFAAGIIEIGQTDSNQIKKDREMMSDRQKLSLFSPAFSDVNDEIDQRNLKLKPLAIIRTKGGVPRYAQIPGVSTADLALQDRDEASFKRAVGIDERTLGIESTGPAITATEASFLREAALKRLREFAFLYKNVLLQREVKLKLSLFKQYFSNPLTKEEKIKDDKGTRILKAKFKEFKIKTGNTYTKKELSRNFFESEADVDLDLQLLLPMTPAQMATIWSQIIRDTVPAIQAGVVDYSLKKIYDNYIEALTQKNPDALKEDREAVSIEMAETEHNLYADKNTSKEMKEVLPDGTLPEYLNQAHILKHNELLESDIHIEETEKARLLEHISKDIANLKTQAPPQPAQIPPQTLATVGGLQQPIPPAPLTPPPTPITPETPTI